LIWTQVILSICEWLELACMLLLPARLSSLPAEDIRSDK